VDIGSNGGVATLINEAPDVCVSAEDDVNHSVSCNFVTWPHGTSQVMATPLTSSTWVVTVDHPGCVVP